MNERYDSPPPPDLKTECYRILLVVGIVTLVITIVQLIFVGFHGFWRSSAINAIFTFCITSVSFLMNDYVFGYFVRNKPLTLKIIISFIGSMIAIVGGILLAQYLVYLVGLISIPNFLGQKTFWASFIFSINVGLIVSIYYGLKDRLEVAYEEIREKDQKTAELEVLKARAELEALQSKINPHFLFNSLNSIAGLTTIQPEKAEEMTLKLAQLFRSTLKFTDQSFSTIQEELRIIETYLEIEKIRFGKRLSYSIDVSPSLLNISIPQLLIQPIVENAIKHGIEPKTDGGTITVSIQKNNEMCVIFVQDSGVGFKSTASFGYGLTNVKKRLENLYDDLFLLDIESHNGTTITISIPLEKLK
mgnify:CR=1 FL=1